MIDIVEAAAGRNVSRETLELLESYVALLLEENDRQNLISRSTVDEVWHRHIADGAQLVVYNLTHALMAHLAELNQAR